jgi:hypothetical protein
MNTQQQELRPPGPGVVRTVWSPDQITGYQEPLGPLSEQRAASEAECVAAARANYRELIHTIAGRADSAASPSEITQLETLAGIIGIEFAEADRHVRAIHDLGRLEKQLEQARKVDVDGLKRAAKDADKAARAAIIRRVGEGLNHCGSISGMVGAMYEIQRNSPWLEVRLGEAPIPLFNPMPAVEAASAAASAARVAEEMPTTFERQIESLRNRNPLIFGE